MCEERIAKYMIMRPDTRVVGSMLRHLLIYVECDCVCGDYNNEEVTKQEKRYCKTWFNDSVYVNTISITYLKTGE